MVKYLSDFTKICLINKLDLLQNESILIFKVVIEIEFYANNIIYILYIVMVKPIIIASNKQLNGVSQKVAPGLSATQNMILRSRHSGVKSVMLLDCCGYSLACTIGSQSKCPSQCKTYNFNINCSL